MTEQHPITPPPELVQQWIEKYGNSEDPRWQSYEQDIATQAARWGADQELEACCLWLGAGRRENLPQVIALRDARRPKPPSLKEQALQALERVPGPGADPAYLRTWADREGASLVDTIRHALEAIPND